MTKMLLILIAAILGLTLVPLVLFSVVLLRVDLDGNTMVRTLRAIIVSFILSKVALIVYLELLVLEGIFSINFLGVFTTPLFVPVAVAMLYSDWLGLLELLKIRKILQEQYRK